MKTLYSIDVPESEDDGFTAEPFDVGAGASVATVGVLGTAFSVREPIAVGVTSGPVDAAAAGILVGFRTVSNAWITPFVASRFLAWTDAPLTLSPLTSVNISSSPENAFLVGTEIMFAAITFPGRMWYESSVLNFA